MDNANTWVLEYTRNFDQEETERMKRGIVAESMEDKWNIYYENDVLKFYRSWTNKLIKVLHLILKDGNFACTNVEVCAESCNFESFPEAINAYEHVMNKVLLGKKSNSYGDEDSFITWSLIGHSALM